MNRFNLLRKRLFEAIYKQLSEDCHCKSYEGAFEISCEYPNFFEDENAETLNPCNYVITLHCYVVGPNRHYQWSGKTLAKALDKAEKDINSWLEGK